MPAEDRHFRCFFVRKYARYIGVILVGLATLYSYFGYYSRSTTRNGASFISTNGDASVKFTDGDTSVNPWKEVPKFQLFLRMSSYPRFVKEFKLRFLTSYRIFFPPRHVASSLVVALDNDNPKDHELGDTVKASWPYPKVCFIKPAGDPNIYQRSARYRMYWDQFYPDKCIDTEFVGYIDSDVMFFSVVTPNSLFENGKPIVNARIGLANNICWPVVTELLLGHQQALQCMAYFPVIIKVAHVVELRAYISKRMKMSFDEAFTRGLEVGQECLSQFSVLCNYVWLFHRNEYRFHLQMMPDGKWDGELGRVPSMVSLDYYKKEVQPNQMVPKPRVVLHARHLHTKSNKNFLGLDVLVPPASTELDLIIKESLCYNGGFRLCPKGCKQFNERKVFYYFFVFEWFDWNWDKRCAKEQEKYLKEANAVLQYYRTTGQPALGVNSTDELCKLVS